jgi:hypothetical protein
LLGWLSFLFYDVLIEQNPIREIKHMRISFWHCKKNKKKYHLAKWSRLCRSKKKGSLSVMDLRKQNICLLDKMVVQIGDPKWLMANYCKG